MDSSFILPLRVKSLLFELGRYAKYKKDGWHQYILSVDIQNIETPFVAKEIIYNKVSDVFYLNLKNIKSKKWYKYLKIIKNTPIFEFLQQIQDFIFLKDYLKKTITENIVKKQTLAGIWISETPTKNTNYDSNFSNWVDATSSDGFLYFEVDLKKNIASYKVPTQDIYGMKGHYSLYLGRFELTYTQILIWQNDEFPVIIPYILENEQLFLYKNKMIFVREK